MPRILLLFCAAGAAIALYAIKAKKLRTLLFSALTGLAAFFAADLVGAYVGVHVPWNAFTLSAVALGGVPGAILLHLLRALLR